MSVQDPPGGRDTRIAGIEYEIRRTAGDTGANTDYWPLACTGSGFAELPGVRPGTTYQARARYAAHDGAAPGPWTESDEKTVEGFAELDAPANVNVAAIPGGYAVSWDAPEERDYAYTEILEREDGQTAAEVKGRTAASPWPRLGLQSTARLVSVRHVDRAGRAGTGSAEHRVTPDEADTQAARDAAAAAKAAAAQARDAVAGLPDALANEVDARIDAELAPAVVLREKAGEADRLELAALSDLGGAASPARIDAVGASHRRGLRSVRRRAPGPLRHRPQPRAAVGRERGGARRRHNRLADASPRT